ncbi:MAG: class I SAM-dependent RNA methyltransferase [Desulfobulbaceae bacterium]|nr:class I SAM-dependent RNA methyltransferase [Desulfobulbaceae bacterium]
MPNETVKIGKVVTGGKGLARSSSGLVLMVPLGLPGEEVVVRPQQRKKGYQEAELLQVLSAHPQRIAPPCRHFGHCGGCDLQHAAYPLQVEIKNTILQEQLLHGGVLSGEELAVVGSPLFSPSQFGYRQRLRLQIDEAGRWGFFRSRSHELEVIEQCHLAGPEINSVLQKIPTSPALLRLLRNGRELEVIIGGDDGGVVLSLTMRRKPRPADLLAAALVGREVPEVRAIFLEYEGASRLGPFPAAGLSGDDGQPGLVRLEFLPRPQWNVPAYTLTQEAGGFSQVNGEQNRQMIGQVLEWLAGRQVSRAVDLFCGMGNFSIPLALAGIAMTGADLQRSTIRSAQRNAAAAGLVNCKFIQAAAAQVAGDLVAAGERFDLVILDPPRRGCAEVVPFLAALHAPLVLYISCDPATLARDLRLLKAQGYQLERARMVDMFPQTAHLESMVLLRK